MYSLFGLIVIFQINLEFYTLCYFIGIIISSFFQSFFESLSTGTTERVCLIQGTVEALNAVHGFIAEKIREMPQNVAKTEPVSILQPQTTVNPDRIKQVSV